MLSVYIFSVALGGGLLLLSVLGDVVDGDAGDLDIEADLDLDADLDVDGEGADTSKLFSIRTATYSLFGFGAVGSILSWVGFSPTAPSTVGFSALGGVSAAGIVAVAFRYLAATDTGSHPGDDSLVGLTGRVLIPMGSTAPGQIAVERGGRRLSLRAKPHHLEDTRIELEDWRSVVIVEMKDGVALDAPVQDDLITDGG